MATQKNKIEVGNVRLGRKGDRPYWVLMVSVCIRALHQIGAAVILGAFILGDTYTLPPLYLILAGVSGLLLMLTEGLRHRQLFREFSGISTIVKLVILGLAYHGGLPVIPAVLFAFVLASFSSHAPKSIRHRLLY